MVGRNSLDDILIELASEHGLAINFYPGLYAGPYAVLFLPETGFVGKILLEEFRGWENSYEGVALLDKRLYHLYQQAHSEPERLDP
jgi:hypothetical protein